MLERALRVSESALGFIATYDGEHFHMAAGRGLPPAFAEIASKPYRPPPGAPSQRLIDGKAFVQIADLLEDEGTPRGLSPVHRALVEAAGGRSFLTVPLRREGVLVGVIVIYRREVRPFSDKQITLLQNFAEQAVIAIENARLITETREALDQQTATADVLQVINSSPGNLAPVFDAILEKAHNLCGVAAGSMQINERGKFRAVAMRGVPDPVAEVLHRPFEPKSGAPAFRLLAGEPFVHIADMLESSKQRPENPRAAMNARHGIRTVLFVPLRKDSDLLGYISAYRFEVRAFTDKQIALLQNFAAQAVIAMENARLLTETREALEQQTATAEVLQVINSSPGDLAPVFDAILEKAHTLCGAATGSLRIFDGDIVRAVAIRGQSGEFADRLRNGFPASSAPLLEPLRDGAPFVHISDVADRDDPMSRLSAEHGNRTVLAVPLRKEDTLLGMIVASRQEVRPFSDKQIALLQNFAAQAVIAMENARLITETREALEQQTATAEVLQVINSSLGNLAPVFDAMLEKAMRLSGAVHGSLTSYHGEHFRCVASHSLPEALFEVLRKPRRAAPNSPQERLLRGEPIVHIADMAAMRTSRDDEVALAAAEIDFVRTIVFVPLRKDNTLLGYITATRQEVRPFSEKQIALLQNFAAQAVIAMENARLLGELRQRTDEVAELNRGLEARVAEQVEELGRVGRLKRFLAPQLAELIVSQGNEKILESHRREIVVVFCDLRGYTAFTETAEPEEVLDFLREYHGALGPLVSQFEGTLDQFSGDGIMVFFNDPVPCPDPAERAVKMAMAMREEAGKLIATWRERGRELGFGAGIAQGYATLGQIGFADRSGYTAIGTVCNVAARLCAEAKDGQILVSQRVNAALAGNITTEQLGALALKGLAQPVMAFNVPVVSSANVVAIRPERERIPRDRAH
jgi:GAF domain-containing protein